MSNQWEKPAGGTLRITNPITLNKWKANGEYDKLLNAGYIYAQGCGRFRKFNCKCSKCRKWEQ